MQDNDPLVPSVLHYGRARHKRILILPWIVAAAHFVVTSALWRYGFGRLMKNLVGPIFNPSYRPPPPNLIDRFADVAGPWLMLPFREPILEIDPHYIIALDSVAWGMVVWCMMRLFRHIRPPA
ncbi:MAG TPA: hypothetical protein VHY37_11035 [Tepidisphaeraceae bacterium]|nr:hypothetical protein [Tepidisphaeraceae bacterium]